MANWPFNIARGKVRYFCELPGAADALELIPIETTGLEADPALRDYDTVAALLAGSSNEQTTMGRKTITAPVVTVDDTGETATVDLPTQTYTAPGGGAVSAWILCYVPEVGISTDAARVPLLKWDRVVTPDGINDVEISLPSGAWTSSDPA